MAEPLFIIALYRMNSDNVSLNKYISSSGFCSRREADKLIEQGRVTINGKKGKLGARVAPGDDVEIDGEAIKSSAKKRPTYIALNKPVGITSTTDTKDKTNIIDFMAYPNRIFPVGRLDKDSDGLIFLTNDGDIVNKILRASNLHEKEYVVTVDKPIDAEFVKRMSGGIPILDTTTSECFVKQEGARRFRIILTQGLNRQIRRMCEYLGFKVVSLTRVRIMNIKLGDLPAGKWRYFTPAEIDRMNELVAESVKTELPAPKVRTPKPAPLPAKGKEKAQEAKGKSPVQTKSPSGAKSKPKPGAKAPAKQSQKSNAPSGSGSKTSFKEYRRKGKK